MKSSLASAQPNKLCGTLFFGALMESATALPRAVNSTPSAEDLPVLGGSKLSSSFRPFFLLLPLAIAPLFVYFRGNPRTTWLLPMCFYNLTWCLAMYGYDASFDLTCL